MRHCCLTHCHIFYYSQMVKAGLLLILMGGTQKFTNDKVVFSDVLWFSTFINTELFWHVVYKCILPYDSAINFLC